MHGTNTKDEGNNFSDDVYLSHDPALKEELECCVLLVTAKKESTPSVEMLVDGLGFRDVVIRRLSDFKFLAYFSNASSLEDVDLDFLSIAFMEVRKITEEDLVLSRQAWIEIRGLPIHGWTKENYALLLKPWGNIIHFGRTLDDDLSYVTPKLLIDTMHMGKIEESKKVALLGKKWKIKLVETYGVDSDLHFGSVENSCMGSDNEDVDHGVHCPSPPPCKEADKVSEVCDVEIVNVTQDEDRVSATPRTDNNENSEGKDGSCINPVTPRTEQVEVLGNIAHQHQGLLSSPEKFALDSNEECFHTAHWIPRDKESSPSFPCPSSEDEKSVVEEGRSPMEETESFSFSSGVLKELTNLKVQVKRGRPRKYKHNQVSKHFKVPRRKKTRGEGLQQISHYFLNANFDEAEAAYETGLMMGLLPLNSKDKSLELIKANLR